MTYYMIRCLEGGQWHGDIAVRDPDDAAAVVLALATVAPEGARYEVERVESLPF